MQPDASTTAEKQTNEEEKVNENNVEQAPEMESYDERESTNLDGADDGTDDAESDGGGQQPFENERLESPLEKTGPTEAPAEAPAEDKVPSHSAQETTDVKQDEPQQSSTDESPANKTFAAWKQKAMKKMAEKGTKKAGA